jgi:DNA-binding MarR family transcriptional regulator
MQPNETTRTLNAIRAIIQAMRINSRAIERDIGLSLAQLTVLERLAKSPGQSVTELADHMYTHQSSMSVVVDRLVAKGLVERRGSTADRRRVELSLTEPGAALLALAPETISHRLTDALVSLSKRDRLMLARAMETLVTLAELEDSGAAS